MTIKLFSMRLHPHMRRKTSQGSENGYILLTLILAVALMSIVALAAVTSLKFNMRRDREQEMIHRGVQYSNAIRRFYKKFGRYPTKIEDLENTSNMKFLRKRYQDPLNCKAGKCEEFKLLHYSDVASVIAGFGGGIAGATSISAMNGQAGAGGLGQASPLGQSPLGQSTFGQSSLGQSSSFGSGNSFGASSNSPFGQQQNQAPASNQPGTDSSQPGSQTSSESGTDNNASNSTDANGNSTDTNQPGSGQVIGGQIVGVASATKDTDPTVREFNHKKKYKDWMFIYDPTQDQGRLITTPYQPFMQNLTQAPNVNGQNGQNNNGTGTSTFGSSPSGFQNPTPNGGFGNPGQPSPAPQQPPQ